MQQLKVEQNKTQQQQSTEGQEEVKRECERALAPHKKRFPHRKD